MQLSGGAATRYLNDTGQSDPRVAPVTPTVTPTVPVAGAPVVSPIQRTVDPGGDAADTYLSTFQAPETAAQIAERLRQGSQGAIDSINKTYDDQVAAAGKTGQEKLNMDNAVSVLSGLTGSTEAARTRGATLDANDKTVQAINNERLAKTQAIYSQISGDAEKEAQQQKEDATKSAEDIVTRRTASQAKALDNIKTMAAGGLVDFDSFKNSPQNQKVYQYALDAAGGSEDNLRAIFAMNRPKDQLVGTPTRAGDHFIQAYQNPLTGKVSYDKVEVPGGLPAEYNTFQKIGDATTGERLLAIPDGWDGDMSKVKVIASTNGVGANKPLTQVQITASGFANRTQQANAVIGGLETKISSMNPLAYQTQVAAEGSTIAHGFASPDIQQARQAERNFVNAVLRRESGAAISQSEFDNAEQQYFPRPGDAPATLAQKAENRTTVINSLNEAAGGAPAASTPSSSSDPLGLGI